MPSTLPWKRWMGAAVATPTAPGGPTSLRRRETSARRTDHRPETDHQAGTPERPAAVGPTTIIATDHRAPPGPSRDERRRGDLNPRSIKQQLGEHLPPHRQRAFIGLKLPCGAGAIPELLRLPQTEHRAGAARTVAGNPPPPGGLLQPDHLRLQQAHGRLSTSPVGGSFERVVQISA